MNTQTATACQADIGFQENLYNDANPTRRWLHTSRRQWVSAQLAKYTATPGTRVFEVGVGAGIYTRLMSNQQCEIFAVDINADFLNAVSLLPGVMVSCCDATRDIQARNYDLGLCSEVLEHVRPEDSRGMLRCLYQSVKPGGIVILTTPQRTSTMETFIRLLQFRPFMALAKMIYGQVDDLGHINVLSARELQTQLKQTGFNIIEHTQLALYLPVLAEFGGSFGQRTAAFLARCLRGTCLSGLLWTQAYVLRRLA
jgi:2-polyprenyl-3-methyl-5-hydroxy-6-metoxy-1,4-benzoquinol methylase